MKYKFLTIFILIFNMIAFSATPQTVSEALSSINISAENDPSPSSEATDTTLTTAPIMDDAELDNLIKLLGDPARVDEFKNNLELIQKAQTTKEKDKQTTPNLVTYSLFEQVKIAFSQLYTAIVKLPDAKIQIAPLKKIADPNQDSGYKDVRQWKELILYLFGSFLGIMLFWILLDRIFLIIHNQLLDAPKMRRLLPFLAQCILRVILVFLPIAILYFTAHHTLANLLVHDVTLQQTIKGFTRPLITIFILGGIVRLAIAPRHKIYRLIPCRTIIASWLMARINRLGLAFFLVLVSYVLTEIPRPPSASINYLLQFITGVIYLFCLVSFILALRRVVFLYYRVHREKLKNNRLIWLYDWIVDYWYLPIVVFLLCIGFYWFLDVRNREFWLISNTVDPFLYLITLLAAINLVDYLVEKFYKHLSRKAELSRKFRKQSETLIPLIKTCRSIIIFIMIIIFILSVIAGIGFDSLTWIKTERGSGFISILFSLIALGFLWIIIKEVTNTFMNRYLSTKNEDGEYINDNARMRTVLPLLKNIFLIILAVGFLLAALSVIGVNITPFLAGAGVLGIAIGFGSQKLVADFITGVFNLIEDTMQVGDVVEVNGLSGTVEQLSIRSLKLRDLAGHVHTIPFGSIDNVSNLTKEYSYALMEIGVGYRENVDDVMKTLADIGEKMLQDSPWRFYILEDLEILGLDSLGDSSVNIKCRFKTRAGKKWSVAREFNRRVKNRFDELDIEIPFPHMTVYFGTDKQGNAPAAHLRFQGKETIRETTKEETQTQHPTIDSDTASDAGEGEGD